jgi:hypothetical protein
MTTWTEPDSVHLSSNDVTNLVNGLLDEDSRAEALAFVDTIDDPGYLRVIAAAVAYELYRPSVPIGTADDYRTYIRDIRR